MPDDGNRVNPGVASDSPGLDEFQRWREELRGFFHEVRTELRRLAEHRVTQSHAARATPPSEPQRANPPVSHAPEESAMPGPNGNLRPAAAFVQGKHSSRASDAATADSPDRLESLKRQIAARLHAKSRTGTGFSAADCQPGGIPGEHQPTADTQR